jgi:hypothetical protein
MSKNSNISRRIGNVIEVDFEANAENSKFLKEIEELEEKLTMLKGEILEEIAEKT